MAFFEMWFFSEGIGTQPTRSYLNSFQQFLKISKNRCKILGLKKTTNTWTNSTPLLGEADGAICRLYRWESLKSDETLSFM